MWKNCTLGQLPLASDKALKARWFDSSAWFGESRPQVPVRRTGRGKNGGAQQLAGGWLEVGRRTAKSPILTAVYPVCVVA